MSHSLVERGLDASAKSNVPGQTAQSTQADLGRTFCYLLIFCITGIYHPLIHFIFKTERRICKVKVFLHDVLFWFKSELSQ